jgi:ATP-binding cassette, subfamily B, bacterial
MSDKKESFLGEMAAKGKQRFTKDGFRKLYTIFKYAFPYRVKYILGLIALAFSIATTLAFPKLLGEILAVLENKSAYTMNQVIGLLCIVLVLQSVFSFLRVYFFTQVSERTIADLRKALYSKIISLPLYFFEQRRVGELMSRITSDIAQLQGLVTTTVAEFIRQFFTIIVGVVIISLISWKLTIFMLATFPVLVIIALVFGRYIRKLASESQKELAAANVIVEETFQSVQVVKSYTNEHLEIKRYSNTLAKVVDLAMRTALFRGGFISFIIFALFGSIIAIVWYASGLVQQGQLQINQMITFVFYTMFIGGSLNGLGEMIASVQVAIGASERVLDIFDEKPELEPVNNALDNKKLKGKVTFQNVSFTYPSRDDVQVLKDISLDIAPGKKIALVGYSGAGKSTIVQLLLRFYQRNTGTILVDDKDINTYALGQLRHNMAIVPQEVQLFGGSIRENIAYGKPTASDAEIIDAAKKANAWQFIEGFPESLDTVVGERGIKLSGGQRQRIAIARAILKDPAILLLDEATSALDSESEALVQAALEVLMEGRTTIIIAHRLSTIRNVDQIYVLNEGKIAETGSHEQLLLQNDGIYANLVKMQIDSLTDEPKIGQKLEVL